MFGTGWLTIRQAQEALKNGRLEEAHRLLGQSAAQGHKGSWELLQQVAVGFVRRGQRHLRQDDCEAAWNDLLLAEQVGLADDSSAMQLRQQLVQRGLEEIKSLLQAGDASRAQQIADQLLSRNVHHSELRRWQAVAQGWSQAREQADRGEWALAQQTVERLRQLAPELTALERFQQELHQRRQTCITVLGQLHEAVAQGHWRRVVELADQVLSVAPLQAQARKAREQAWRVLEPSTIGWKPRPAQAVASAPESSNRFLLWIDGIGGYLVCLGSRVIFGQATPEALVDVPLYADISRIHATLMRDGGSYLLEAVRPVQVNGQPVDKALLQTGDRVTLGTSCQFQFNQPAPVSASARLDLTSGHRLGLAVDAVLLMADTLVLGPGTQAHVALPELPRPLVLFRHKDGLGARYAGHFSVDGQQVQDRIALRPNARLGVEDYSLAIEMIGTRLGAG